MSTEHEAADTVPPPCLARSCNRCGRAFTAEAWWSLPAPAHQVRIAVERDTPRPIVVIRGDIQTWDDLDEPILYLRNCPCGGTMAQAARG